MASKNSTTSGASRGNGSGAAPRLARTSIHTPLQPASVQDLKAKFDQSKGSGDSGTSGSGGATSPRHQAKGAEASSSSSVGLKKSAVSSSTNSSSGSKLGSSGVTLSGLSSSLQTAANRKVGSGTLQSSSTSSSSFSSSSTSSSTGLSATAKSSIALTTARPFQPSSSSSKSNVTSATGSGRNSPILGKTGTKSNTLSSSSSSSLSSSSSSGIAAKWEPKSSGTKTFSKDKEGRLELPVMHITTTGNDVSVEARVQTNKWSASRTTSGAGADAKKDVTGSRYLGKKVSETKGAFDKPTDITSKTATSKLESSSKPSSPSPPVQRTKKIIAREIKIERLDSGAQITTYKDGGGVAAVNSGKSSSSDTAGQAGKTDSAGKVGPGKKIVEIKVQQGTTSSGRSSPASPASTSSTGSRPEQERVPEFRQIKLRKAQPSVDKNTSSTTKGGSTSIAGASLAVKESEDSNKRLSRKISAERFERLMFDFQRGVPTEAEADPNRRGSETDHILLQEKVRSMATSRSSGGRRKDKDKDEDVTPDGNQDDQDVPIINKKKKEESIFTEGLKVSDFVKQVNKLNPGAEAAPPPKWKVQRAQSQASSATSSDVGTGDASGADSYYQGIPGEDMANFSDEEDDIYEKVTQREPSSVSTDGEQDTGDSAKAPGRRLGVYSQMKNLKNLAFRKLKAKGGKKKAGKSTKTETLSDSEEVVVHSDGEGGWHHNRGDNPDSDDSGDSTGTEYEDVGPDSRDFDEEVEEGVHDENGNDQEEECPYEDLESLGLGRGLGTGESTRGGSGRGTDGGKNKTLTHKLKNIFYNKKAKAAKKSKPVVDSGVSADTDSDTEQADASEGQLGQSDSTIDLPAIDAISRTSSERSSGRFARDDTGSATATTTTTAGSAAAAPSTYTLASAIGGDSGNHSASSVSSTHHSLGGDNRSKSSSSLSTTTSSSALQPAAGATTTATASTQATSSSTTTAATTSSSTASSSSTSTTSSAPMSSSNMPPPPLPPRTSKNLTQPPENSPPLPPRNPSAPPKTATLGIPLDTVVPVSPTGNRSSMSGSKYDKKKDRFSFGHDGSEAHITPKLDYIDYDPASAQTLDRIERPDPTTKRRKSLFGRRTNASSRPVSSSSNTSSSGGGSNSNYYMYPDLSAFPQLKGGNSDDNLYVDLEDEHIYGKASDIYQSRFESEPLYQWYSKDKMIQNTRSDKSTSDDLSDEEYLELEEKTRPESVYEDVERLLEKTSTLSVIRDKASNKSNSTLSEPVSTPISARDKPQRRSVIEDVFKNGGNLHRALWCQMPEVMSSGLLDKLSDQEKKIQEAMFEIMTSEASYQRSLKVLISVFLMAPEFSADMSDRCVITRRDRQVLFSNIGHIKDISEDFLRDLEERWQESCHMKDVCDIIHKHASQTFEPYVRYCSNQAYQDRALNNLKQNPEFSEAVRRLEQNSQCQFLPLASFLLLPMQRITRLPLLVDAIAHRVEPGCALHTSCKKALDSLTKVAKRCDEAAKKMQQAEQMCLLASNLEFKVKEFPLVSASRFLVKQGELNMIKADGTNRKPLSKLLGSNKEHVYLYLFNDVLLVTKKKGSTFQVRDYCQRNSLYVEAVDNPDKSRHLAPGVATGVANLLFLALLANHDNKQVELVLSCKSESERTRWVEAISPSSSAGDTERIYDYWDCPQFHCVRKYIAQQPDELTLQESDVINVTRKMADGWCEGERIRDGEKGWFPASHTEEINNSHVRARNLRMRYRLMMASQEYAQMEFGNRH